MRTKRPRPSVTTRGFPSAVVKVAIDLTAPRLRAFLSLASANTPTVVAATIFLGIRRIRSAFPNRDVACYPAFSGAGIQIAHGLNSTRRHRQT